jgi:hypothetical protein
MVAGPLELYRRIGMPPEQIQVLEESQMPLTMMGLGGALFALALAGYAVWLRRYFVARDPLPDGDPGRQE